MAGTGGRSGRHGGGGVERVGGEGGRKTESSGSTDVLSIV